eukprot:gene34978-45268_t
MLLDHCDIEDVESTTPRTDDASYHFKDAGQTILEEPRVKGPIPSSIADVKIEEITENLSLDRCDIEEPQLTGPISSGIVDVKVEGLKVAEDVFCELNRMEMTNQLRVVNSVDYPVFNAEKNMYEIIVTGDEGNRFEQGKEKINSNPIVMKNVKVVKINFRNEIYGKVEKAGGQIGDTVYREDTVTTVVGSYLSRLFGNIKTSSMGLVSLEENRYAVVTAAHLCTAHAVRLTSNASARYHYQDVCISGLNAEDYAVVDIIPSPSVIAESTNYFDLNTVNMINQVFVDNDGSDAVNVHGKIMYVGGDFVSSGDFAILRFRRGSGAGLLPWATQQECDLKLEKGDSGDLLFCESDVPGQLIALGVLSMIDVNRGVSYFTSLFVCFDTKLFELP